MAFFEAKNSIELQKNDQKTYRRQLWDFDEDNVAEWLRRQPAKLMGFARVGSNPTVVVFFFEAKRSG